MIRALGLIMLLTIGGSASAGLLCGRNSDCPRGEYCRIGWADDAFTCQKKVSRSDPSIKDTLVYESSVVSCNEWGPKDFHLAEASMDCEGRLEIIEETVSVTGGRWGDSNCSIYYELRIKTEYLCVAD